MTIISAVFLLLVLVVGLAVVSVRPDLPLSTLEEKYTNAYSHFVEIGSVRVHYRDQGQGPALVLLHGTFASLHTWDGWADSLREEYRVIRLDLPGFGLTGPRPSGDYRLATEVSFLHEFLEMLSVDRFYLVGNSLGGHIAWRYALNYPEQVQKLILLDSAGARGWNQAPWIFRLVRELPIPEAATVLTPRFLVRLILHHIYADPSRVDPPLVDLYFDLVRRPGNRSAFVQRAKLHEPSRFDELIQLNIPTLLIWGAEDPWIPLEIAREFERILPRAHLSVIEGAGHLPMEERPAATLRPVRPFLRSASRSPAPVRGDQ
ncbi:MAG: alpha/beta hydrolase [Anaerolineales bacterium]|nr:alpha/beta hydrolase [Anaerolineales bacterium]